MEASIKKKKEVDLTNGNLFKKIIIVALPLMFSGILQLLYNAADLIVCGTFGTDHAVGAISATNSLINLIVQLFLGFSVGANVLMARTYGAKDREKCSRVAHSAIVLSLIVGVVIGALGCVFSRFFLELMDTPDEVIDLSHTYLFIYFLGLPFSMLYNFGASLLRAVGDTKRPFYFLAFAGLINVLLNLFLVIVCGLDVAGVAIGTVASQFVSSILVLICLLKTSGYCKIGPPTYFLNSCGLKGIRINRTTAEQLEARRWYRIRPSLRQEPPAFRRPERECGPGERARHQSPHHGQ